MFKVVSGKCNGSISYYLFQDVLNDLFIHFYSLMKLRYSVKFRDILFFLLKCTVFWKILKILSLLIRGNGIFLEFFSDSFRSINRYL